MAALLISPNGPRVSHILGLGFGTRQIWSFQWVPFGPMNTSTAKKKKPPML